jgi:HlyD family secretion protein
MPRRRWGRWFWLLALAATLAAVGWLWLSRAPSGTVRYETAPVETGDLTVTVTATGTVQPTTRIDISSELSGTLASVEVDFNDEVSEGQVLARLDDTNLRARLTTAEAQKAAARARVTQAEATASETTETWTSTQELDARGLATRSVVVAARAAHDRALAAVEIARADLQLAEASLAEAQADLEKAVIRSPITGIVLNRAAEKGQIVAATLNAPVLFTLAEDLSRMELQVGIDEADIGRVAVGNEAVFTVDAHPGQTFPARITQLRDAP